MKNKLTKIIFFVLIIGLSISQTSFLHAEGLLDPSAAQDIKDMTSQIEQSAGFQTTNTVGDVIAIVIKAFLSLLALIFVILIILAGFNWMTAEGDEDKVRKAKDTIKRAMIGLTIILAAYAITYFVFAHLSRIVSVV